MFRQTYSVTDDSGFLALVDPDAYSGFVSSDWKLSDVLAKFAEQMASRALLIWGTGAENTWKVSVGSSLEQAPAFRHCDGSILSSKGRLLLTNYESLTMAAQFDDIRLPEAHQVDLLLQVTPGLYRCRITQLQDPGSAPPTRGDDFTVQLDLVGRPLPVWSAIPWSDGRQ